MPWEHSARRNRGFAFVTFATFDVADRVCQQRYFHIQQHKVEVKHAVPRAQMMQQYDEQVKMHHIPGTDSPYMSQQPNLFAMPRRVPSPEPIHLGNPAMSELMLGYHSAPVYQSSLFSV